MYGRADVQFAFAQIRSEGLPDWLHQQVEEGLGRRVDREHPDALAVQKALQVLADYDDYMGVDRVESVQEARPDGRLVSDLLRQGLSAVELQRRWVELAQAQLRVARENEAGEVASAAYEILLAKQWTPDFTDVEADALRQLQAWQRTGEHRPDLPAAIEQEGRELVSTRMRAVRGEIPRTKRVSRTDRRRTPTYHGPSFRTQLGRLATETDEREVRKLIAELARQARARKIPVYSASTHSRRS